MNSFQSILERDVEKRIRKLPSKSCELDLMPTTLLKSAVDVVTPAVTCIINMSLLSGEFCKNLKLAHLKPLIKKTGLNLVFKSFCPVRSLSYISKLIERFAAEQLVDHVTQNGLGEKYQLAYRALHSNETALTHVRNDILLNMDNRKSACLVLLNLSAAFDMFDYATLLNHLQSRFKITGVVLKWIKSYLSDRTQAVVLKNEEGETAMSDVVRLSMGVPQGSVLGPLLFTLFTTALGDICRQYDQDFHLYADDTQLYASFIASSEECRESCMLKINSCVVEISKWMSMNLLKLNENKSAIMFIATCQQLSKFLPQIGSSVRLNGIEIRHSSSVRNLGYLMDSKFKNDAHINQICSTFFLYLQNTIKEQHSMDKKTVQVVVQVLVLFRIDYCNALLMGSFEYQIDKLQRIQNMACRIICSVRKYDSISYHLKDLHWLHVYKQIAYKICILMFKCFRDIAPKYLTELVRFDSNHNRNLQSKLKFLALVPRCNNVQTSMSAFFIIGPKLWNGLPVTLKVRENIKDFKVALKTHSI